MKKVLNALCRLKSDEEGAALLEYTVLLAVLLVAVIAVIVAVGDWIHARWTHLNTALQNIGS